MPASRFAVRNTENGLELGSEIVLAGSSRERRTGLLKHQNLTENGGLWINPCEAIHTWGMNFAIDVVFLDARNRVVKVREALPARRICICIPATSVLELPPGTIARSGTRPGHILALDRL